MYSTVQWLEEGWVSRIEAGGLPVFLESSHMAASNKKSNLPYILIHNSVANSKKGH